MLVFISLLFVTLRATDCVDQPNWGCDLITDANECNGLQMKKCLKACGMCGGEAESAEEPEPENPCTETFEAECEVCTEGCNGAKYVITTRGEGQNGKFGCTYPKEYNYADEGENCPEIEEESEEKEEEEETLEDCSCGLDAVKGEEKFQSGSVEGEKMCQFGTNCATFFEGCDGKGATVCSLKITYAPEDCSCGLDAVKGEEKFQSGSVEGEKMCQFGTNCATFFEGCDGKGATVCNLKITYATVATEPVPTEPTNPTVPTMPASEESEESEEPEVTCSKADCIKPCKGRRKKQCQVRKNSQCADKRKRGKGRKQRFYSSLACAETSETFVYEPVETSWTVDDIAIYAFALIGLVALTKGALVAGKQLRGEKYQLVEE